LPIAYRLRNFSQAQQALLLYSFQWNDECWSVIENWPRRVMLSGSEASLAIAGSGWHTRDASLPLILRFTQDDTFEADFR